LTANDAVVAVRLDLPGVIDNILRILSKTTNVAIVIGNSPLEKYWVNELHREFQPFTSRVNFVWLNDLSLDEMKKRVANLPANSAIFYALGAVDVEGVPYEQNRALTEIHTVTNAPIFSFVDSYFGNGIVGGPPDVHQRFESYRGR
jgi:hypothetical protein